MRTNAHEIWSKRVSRWKESGLTAKEFAVELGISANSLKHWKWRLASQARPKAAKKHRDGGFVTPHMLITFSLTGSLIEG
jgi:hypothetical protein